MIKAILIPDVERAVDLMITTSEPGAMFDARGWLGGLFRGVDWVQDQNVAVGERYRFPGHHVVLATDPPTRIFQRKPCRACTRNAGGWGYKFPTAESDHVSIPLCRHCAPPPACAECGSPMAAYETVEGAISLIRYRCE